MYDKLKQILIDEMDIEEEKIVPEADLMNDLGLNSLELAELVVHCEEEFGIEFDEEETKELLSVGDVAQYLEKLVR